MSRKSTNKRLAFNSHPIPFKRIRKDYLQQVPDLEAEKIELKTLNIPKSGTLVERNKVRRAGCYILGPEIGNNSPVDSITPYLARKENTNEFFKLLVLTIDDSKNELSTKSVMQGKMLIHTEFSLLSLLHDVDGVTHHHGLFSDLAYEEKLVELKKDQQQSTSTSSHKPKCNSTVSIYTGKVKKRIILVLDCVQPHEFCSTSSAYINLQKYIINARLPEKHILTIFYEVVKIVEKLHDRNIIHRDLKLNNIVLNKITNKITLTNFCLGKHLTSENDQLYDQRGSPAYISPDVLCGKPYRGKPSDIWALGVVLYTMMYSKFPFIEQTPAALFKKIRQADYAFPGEIKVSEEVKKLIKSMLTLMPDERQTASEIRYKLEKIIKSKTSVMYKTIDQVVPDIENNCKEKEQSKASFLKDAPKFELSSEPLSHYLEMLSVQKETTKPNFIKPSHFSIERLDRPINGTAPNTTAASINIITPNEVENRARDIVTPISNNNNNNNNTEATNNVMHIGITRNLTRQISNLSVRTRNSGNTSWHNLAIGNNLVRFGIQNSMAQNIYEIRLNNNNSNSSTNSNNSTNIPTGANSTANNSNYFNDVPTTGGSDQHLLFRINANIPLTTATSPVANVSNPAPVGTNRALSNQAQELFNSLNSSFTRGDIPAMPNRDFIMEFHGIVTQNIANKLSTWLRTNFRNHEIVQELFLSNSASNNVRFNVLELFRRFSVEMELINGVETLKKEQSLNILVFLTYMLQVAGYSNSYFLRVRN